MDERVVRSKAKYHFYLTFIFSPALFNQLENNAFFYLILFGIKINIVLIASNNSSMGLAEKNLAE